MQSLRWVSQLISQCRLGHETVQGVSTECRVFKLQTQKTRSLQRAFERICCWCCRVQRIDAFLNAGCMQHMQLPRHSPLLSWSFQSTAAVATRSKLTLALFLEPPWHGVAWPIGAYRRTTEQSIMAWCQRGGALGETEAVCMEALNGRSAPTTTCSGGTTMSPQISSPDMALESAVHGLKFLSFSWWISTLLRSPGSCICKQGLSAVLG